MAEIYDNDISAVNNNSVPPAGWPENMQYSQVNNTGREQMAVLARYIEANGALTTTGTDPAYILTITQAIIALANGMVFAFKADKTNAVTAPTLQINALAAAALVDGEGNALPIGAIISGRIYAVQYDGVAFQVMNPSTQFTAAERAKLAGIEAGATGDQTGAEIKSLYEAEADTNAFDDAAVAKLAGIEAGATAEVAATESVAGIAEIATQGETDAGTDDARFVTPAKLAAFSGLPSAAASQEKSLRANVTTLSLDTSFVSVADLSAFALTADRIYAVEAFLLTNSPSTAPDVKFRFQFPVGAIITGADNLSAWGHGTAIGQVYDDQIDGIDFQRDFQVNGLVGFNLRGQFINNNATLLDFEIGALNSSATLTTLEAGSWVRVTDMGPRV